MPAEILHRITVQTPRDVAQFAINGLHYPPFWAAFHRALSSRIETVGCEGRLALEVIYLGSI